MKNSAAFILCFLFAGAISAIGQGVPPLINYQGRLTDAAGLPLSDGAYRVAFKLWNDPIASSTNAATHLIWGNEYGVTLIGGVFNVILGANGGTPISGAVLNDLSFAFGESNRFLGLTIVQTPTATIPPNQQREILPRQAFLSTPFALMAQNLVPGTLKQANVDPAFLLEILQPPGTIEAFGGASTPAGWLLCDGRAVSSGQYPRLFSTISTNWGAGIPASTNNFNLPDLRGYFLRGVDPTAGRDPDSGSRANSAGVIVGNMVGSYQLDAAQGHNHALYYRNPDGGFAATGPGVSGILIRLPSLEAENTGGPTKAVKEATTDGSHGTPRLSSETRPINAYVNYIIKY